MEYPSILSLPQDSSGDVYVPLLVPSGKVLRYTTEMLFLTGFVLLALRWFLSRVQKFSMIIIIHVGS